MIKSAKAFVKTNSEHEGHTIPDEIKTHSEEKAKVIPDANKTHSADIAVCKIVPGKGATPEDIVPPDGGLTLDSGTPITNYGTAIAHLNGILKRSLLPFPEVLKALTD